MQMSGVKYTRPSKVFGDSVQEPKAGVKEETSLLICHYYVAQSFFKYHVHRKARFIKECAEGSEVSCASHIAHINGIESMKN